MVVKSTGNSWHGHSVGTHTPRPLRARQGWTGSAKNRFVSVIFYWWQATTNKLKQSLACTEWLLIDDRRVWSPKIFLTLECAPFFLFFFFLASWPLEISVAHLFSLAQNFLFLLWQVGWLIGVQPSPPCSFNTHRICAVSVCCSEVDWLTAERWVGRNERARGSLSISCAIAPMYESRLWYFFLWLIVQQRRDSGFDR